MNQYEIRAIIFGVEQSFGFYQASSPTEAIEIAKDQGMLHLPADEIITVAAITSSGLMFQFTMSQA